MKRYRVVTDGFSGYEAQYRPWYLPFYRQLSRKGYGYGTNTSGTIEEALEIIERHKKRGIVWED